MKNLGGCGWVDIGVASTQTPLHPNPNIHYTPTLTLLSTSSRPLSEISIAYLLRPKTFWKIFQDSEFCCLAFQKWKTDVLFCRFLSRSCQNLRINNVTKIHRRTVCTLVEELYFKVKLFFPAAGQSHHWISSFSLHRVDYENEPRKSRWSSSSRDDAEAYLQKQGWGICFCL